MNNKGLESVKNMKLLGIIFDSTQTFIDHLKMIKIKHLDKSINCNQSNFCFRPAQLSLQSMHVACARSILEYGVLVWYPFLSASNMHKLEILENRALHKIIGVPMSTRILDPHLESKTPPIKSRWDASIAVQSEKHRRHLILDPLHDLAHEQTATRLKRKSWQIMPDKIFNRVNIMPFKKTRTSYANALNIMHTSSLPPSSTCNSNNMNYATISSKISLKSRFTINFAS